MFEKLLPALRKRHQEVDKHGAGDLDFLNELFRGPFDRSPFQTRMVPAVDVSETDTHVEVRAELPGMDPKEVKLTVENDHLVIQGEKKVEHEEKDDHYVRVERSYGSFYRTIPLPSPVDKDKARAEYKNGVLTVHLPKDTTQKPTRIHVQ